MSKSKVGCDVYRTHEIISCALNGRIGFTLPVPTSFKEFKKCIPEIIRQLTYVLEDNK